MLWNADVVELDPSTLGELRPSEVLYEFDGPKIFTSLEHGRLLLAYECDNDDDERVARYLVCPTSKAIVQKLKSGALDVSAALDQPWLHVVDQSYDRQVLRVRLLPEGLASVPATQKPKRGVLLWSHLRSQDSVDMFYLSQSTLSDFVLEAKRFTSYKTDLHERTLVRVIGKGTGGTDDKTGFSPKRMGGTDPSACDDVSSIISEHVISDMDEAGLDYLKARKKIGFGRTVVSPGKIRPSSDRGRSDRMRAQKH